MRAKEFIFERKEQLNLDELRGNPNVRVMLDLIARAEGNTNYDTLVGGGKFKDFSSHPNKTVYLKSLNKVIPSDAAGRYQIMGANWGPYSRRLGLKDFSPESQDKIAIQMIADRGALDSVLKGDYVNGIKKLKSQWASLPSTEVKQGYGPKSWKWVNNNIADLTKLYGVDSSTQVAQKDKPSTIDTIRDVVSTAISPSTAKADKTQSAPTTPQSKAKVGYYSVGDSHAQGVGGYSGQGWTNFGSRGASAFDKQHLQNIKNIPAGSVVALSIGANDIGSKKLSDIVDQVNKTIAASKAKGHQVVYLLPTSSSDPKLQQKREELRQALLKSLDSRDILDLGIAPTSKELKGADGVHLGPEGYKTYGNLITQMFTPTMSQVTPTKVTTEPTVNKLVKPEPSVTPQQQSKSKLTVEPPDSDPEKDPKAWAEYDRRMEKIQAAAGEKYSKERQARLDKEQQSKSKLTVEPPDSDPEKDPKAWAEYDKRMEKIQAAAGDKFSQERAARLEKERKDNLNTEVPTKDAPTLKKTTPYYAGKEGDTEIKRGQTLSGIAKEKGITLSDIKRLNPDIVDLNKVLAGAKIKTQSPDDF